MGASYVIRRKWDACVSTFGDKLVSIEVCVVKQC